MKRIKSQTHYLLETRLLIEELLNANNTITEIGRQTKRDRSNIDREILKHRTIHFPTSFNGNLTCIHKNNCQKIILIVIYIVKNMKWNYVTN